MAAIRCPRGGVRLSRKPDAAALSEGTCFTREGYTDADMESERQEFGATFPAVYQRGMELQARD